MSQIADNRILRITKLFVYLMMGLVALLGAIALGGSALVPFFWSTIFLGLSKSYPAVDPAFLLSNFLAIMTLWVLISGLAWSILRKLLAIIGSVEEANPFVRANAVRLKAIGWLMVGIQIAGVPLEIAGSTFLALRGKPYDGFELPINSILAILLVFILAGIFEHGADMREELEGTV
jgi:hypothetical protein